MPKSALVTGGAKRIGRAIAVALARAGSDVAITYRTSSDEAVETVDAIEQIGRFLRMRMDGPTAGSKDTATTQHRQ